MNYLWELLAVIRVVIKGWFERSSIELRNSLEKKTTKYFTLTVKLAG